VKFCKDEGVVLLADEVCDIHCLNTSRNISLLILILY
jgi:hypothetical protein